jgi:CheY-like chemotaxis protein
MILFVEDDSLSRRAFAQILRAKGYQVAEAENGGEALEILTTGAEQMKEGGCGFCEAKQYSVLNSPR